jgi:hypothetical protein
MRGDIFLRFLFVFFQSGRYDRRDVCRRGGSGHSRSLVVWLERVESESRKLWSLGRKMGGWEVSPRVGDSHR